MNNYRDGLGFASAQGGQMAPYGPTAQSGGIQGNFGVTAGVGGGASRQAGVMGLIVILGGLVLFYVATKKIQGGR